MSDTFASLRSALTAPILSPTKARSGCLSTGSILLDKMLSADTECALRQGDVIWFHGTSGSCRTFLAHQVLAEAANNTFFNDYCLFYDNPMSARPSADFGSHYRTRVEYLASLSVAEWLTRLNEACQSGRRCIYVLDSVNALQGNSIENARLINAQIRNICQMFNRNQSILLYISDDVNSFTPDTTRTLRDVPDKILFFEVIPFDEKYNCCTNVRITVQKRPSLSNFQREHIFTFIPNYGIDDARACFTFLFLRDVIQRTASNLFTLSRLGMQRFTFDEFVDEFDDIKSLIKPLLI